MLDDNNLRMKKILLSVLFTTFASFCSAQNVGEPTQLSCLNNGQMFFTPGCFTNNGETLVVIPDIDPDSQEDVKELNIYDNDFKLIKTIAVRKSLRGPVYVGSNGFSGFESNLYVTQTLFNNDDKFEYIQELENGFNIVSEDGTILQTVTYTNEDTYVRYIINIDNKMYIMTLSGDWRNRRYIYTLYPITRTATGVNSVGAPKKLHVSPTLASRNEPITVDLGDSEICEREIAVVNAAGQTVFVTKVHAGEKSITIDSGKLSRGLNIVKTTSGNKSAEYCKILVR